jgi:hypothetical protein
LNDYLALRQRRDRERQIEDGQIEEGQIKRQIERVDKETDRGAIDKDTKEIEERRDIPAFSLLLFLLFTFLAFHFPAQ